MSRNYYIAIVCIAITAIFMGPAQCRAEVQCPWLNAATAAGILGGEVQTNATAPTSQGDTTCDFKRTQHSVVSSLTIAVHTMALPAKDFTAYLMQCAGTAVSLKGIGNEAVQCVSKDRSGNGGEQIIGRVRDRAFIVDLRRGSTRQPTQSANDLSDEARNTAEQVAGALF